MCTYLLIYVWSLKTTTASIKPVSKCHVAVQFWGLAPFPQTAKDDFSNVDAYAAQLGWYQLFSKKKGPEKHLGFNMPVGN